MVKYIVNRILVTIPIIIAIILIVFLLLQVLPGNPIQVMMKEKVNQAVIDRVTEQMGLNDPLMVRFGRYLWGMLHGDLGHSYKLKRPVTQLIMTAFPNTVKLAITSALVAWIIGIPTGIISAIKKDTLLDRTLMGFSLVGISLPVFWAAMLLQYVLGYKLKLLPISGYSTIRHMIMPAIVLGWASSGSIARLTRSSLLGVMKNDYIRTARAKGLVESAVVLRHGLKNSMIPVVTMMAMQFASLLSGAVITESVFGIGGIGQLMVSAISQRDMPLLQSSVVFSTMIIIIGNLVADILYSFLDPKIRTQ
ncbi:MAG: ABC transporter permease [Firmicutes bacterium]|nr:ABC transporter permease [Bacillota bacterium]MBR0052128.1 ABC transporter permease [Bacillota bacterium]MBR0209310.1 ABC transporter permease [Bacillota bacterium]MBR0516748.1 ABC transporter permease [Bacillota bacterium]MBR3034176.1 ABC transporter permease [Bacillota bacterium]